MNMNQKLQILVQNSMNDLIADYSLILNEISDSEILLKSKTYVIDVVAERDGVSMVYFDTARKPVQGYNLFLFLANKRRSHLVFSVAKPQAATYAEFVESELNSLAQHIRNAGKDILDGSKNWIKNYSWPTVSPSEDVVSRLEGFN